MWLPTFLQRGIHFFDERTEVLAFNNFVLFDRVHLPIIGKRAAVVETPERVTAASSAKPSSSPFCRLAAAERASHGALPRRI